MSLEEDLLPIVALTGRERWIAILAWERAWSNWRDADDLISAASIVGVDHRSLVRAAMECVELALPRGATVTAHERERQLLRMTTGWLNGEDVNITKMLLMSSDMALNDAPNSYSRAIIHAARAAAKSAEDFEFITLDVSSAALYASRAAADARIAAGIRADPDLRSGVRTIVWNRTQNEAQAGFAKYITREPDGPLRWEVIDAAKGAR